MKSSDDGAVSHCPVSPEQTATVGAQLSPVFRPATDVEVFPVNQGWLSTNQARLKGDDEGKGRSFLHLCVDQKKHSKSEGKPCNCPEQNRRVAFAAADENSAARRKPVVRQILKTTLRESIMECGAWLKKDAHRLRQAGFDWQGHLLHGIFEDLRDE